MDQPKMNKDNVKALKQAQIQIKGQLRALDLEMSISNDKVKHFFYDFPLLLRSSHEFMLSQMFIYKIKANPDIVKNILSQSYSCDQTIPDSLLITKPEVANELRKKCKNLFSRNSFMTIFCHSTLPALCQFCMTSYGCDTMINFLSAIEDPKCLESFSSVIFHLPVFCIFLSKITEGLFLTDESVLGYVFYNEFKQRWNNNIVLIPSIVSRILSLFSDLKAKQCFLKQYLFEPLFERPNSFGLESSFSEYTISFKYSISEFEFANFNGINTRIIPDSFANKFPNIFNSTTLTNLDFTLKWQNNISYHLVKIKKVSPVDDLLQSTVNDFESIEVHDILKYGSFIPSEAKTGLSLYDFLNTYCTIGLSLKNLSIVLHNLEKLKTESPSLGKLTKDNLVKYHNEGIKRIQFANEAAKQLAYFKINIEPLLDNFRDQLINRLYMFSNQLNFSADLLHDPFSFQQQFSIEFEKYKSIPHACQTLHNYACCQIDCKYQNYYQSRKELAVLDILGNQLLKMNYNSDYSIDLSQYAAQFIDVCRENSFPCVKLNNMFAVYIKMYQKLKYQSISLTEVNPLHVFVQSIQPINFFSSLIFLIEFITPEIKSLFNERKTSKAQGQSDPNQMDIIENGIKLCEEIKFPLQQFIMKSLKPINVFLFGEKAREALREYFNFGEQKEMVKIVNEKKLLFTLVEPKDKKLLIQKDDYVIVYQGQGIETLADKYIQTLEPNHVKIIKEEMYQKLSDLEKELI